MIANRLSRLLGDRRLSVREVARRTGLAESGLYELYHDRTRRVDFGTLDKLCAVLDCTTGDILEYVPDEEDAGRSGGRRPGQPRTKRRAATQPENEETR